MRRLLPIAIALVVPNVLPAQHAAPSLAAGSSIRVTAPRALPTRTTGAFQATRSDTLWMQPPRSSQVAVPLASVQRLEVRGGRARMKWALIGGGTGLLAGFILGGMAGGQDDITGTGAAIGATAGAAQGLVIGALGGALLAPRRWVEYPLSALR